MSDDNTPLNMQQLYDRNYRPLLVTAGLATEVYEETPDWAARQLAVNDGLIAAHACLVGEVGQEQADHFAAWGRRGPAQLHHMRRVFVVARCL